MYSYYDMSSDWEWIAEACPVAFTLHVLLCGCVLRQYMRTCTYCMYRPVFCGLHGIHMVCIVPLRDADASDILVGAGHAKTNIAQ